MATGEMTTTISRQRAVLAEVIGNAADGTARQSISDLSAQLSGDGGAVSVALSETSDRVAAVEANDAEQDTRLAVLEDSQTTGLLLAETWAVALTITPTVDGTGVEVPDTDIGSHLEATATGYDGDPTPNAGRYRWDASWGRMVRIGDTGLSSKADTTDLIGLVTVALDWSAGSYYDNGTGAVMALGSFASASIAVSAGDVLRVGGTIRASTSVSLIAFIDADGAVLSKHMTGTGSSNTLTFDPANFTAPAGAVLAAFSTLARYTETVTVMHSTVVNGSIVEARAAITDARVDTLAAAASRWEDVPKFWADNGDYLSASAGSFVAGYTSWETGSLTVTPGQTYRVTVAAGGSLTAAWAIVDADGVLLDAENTGITSGATKYFVEDVVTIPPGGAELRVCTKIDADFGMSRVERMSDTEAGWLDYPLDYDDATEAYIHITGGVVTVYDDADDAKWWTWRLGVVPGDTWRMSCGMAGTVATAVAFYDEAGTYISKLFSPGTNDQVDYTNAEFTVPSGAALMAFCVRRDLSRGRERLERLVQDASASRTALTRAENLLDQVVIDSQYGPSIISQWQGRSVLWLGTSIPQGNGTNQYPSKVGDLLGASVTNMALGSSMVRVGVPEAVSATDTLGWTDQGTMSSWNANLTKSLAMTQAEKQAMIDDWDATWGALIGGTAPTSAILDYSYEARLTPYLDSDVIIFDHGHNDLAASVGGYDAGDLTVIPGVDVMVDANSDAVGTRDRRWYIGAMNYLIDVILSTNPKARIVLVGHYENDRKTQISVAQEYLAELWSIPLVRLWEDTGWSQQVVAAGASAGDTITEVWMPDDLHPHSDTTGAATTYLAEILARRLKDIW